MVSGAGGLPEEDFWMQLGAQMPVPASSVAAAVPITATDGVAPARPGDALPRPILQALFEDPKQQVFAVLDAARVFGLPERLSATGLPATCLFQGQALDDMGDVAPWLVQLDRNAPLLQALFSSDPKRRHPGALWDTAPGICIAAPFDLARMRAHLRRFVRVRDETGHWFYLRFWQPEVALDLAHCLSPDNARSLFGGLRVVILDQSHVLHVIDGQGR